MLKLEMNVEARAEVRMAIGDHIEARPRSPRHFPADVRDMLVQPQGAVQKKRLFFKRSDDRANQPGIRRTVRNKRPKGSRCGNAGISLKCNHPKHSR
jgi:hypothetical protein